MKLKELVGLLVVVFVAYWIIAQPDRATRSVNGVLGHLHDAGTNIVTFLTNVL